MSQRESLFLAQSALVLTAFLLAASVVMVAQSGDGISQYRVFGDDEGYQSIDPASQAVDAEIDGFMERTMLLLTRALPDPESAPGLNVRYAVDPVTGAGLSEFTFSRVPSTPTSHVLFVDTERGTYRLFTLDPADIQGDARRIMQYVKSKGVEDREAVVQAGLLDLHAGRVSLEAQLRMLEGVSAERRDYCTMRGHLEVRTWEPLSFPVARTDLSTRFNGYPTYYNLTRWGGCWAAPEIDVGLFTTHWFINICRPGIRFSGNWVTAEMRGRYYNDDFPGNVGRVWVNHIVRIAHNDGNGHIQTQGWAGASGGGFFANSLLGHGINTATRQATSNCYL